MKLSLPLLSLLACSVSACSGTARLVHPREPNATLVIRVIQPAAPGAPIDGVVVDGRALELNDATQLRVLVAPGRHDVWAVRLARDVALVRREPAPAWNSNLAGRVPVSAQNEAIDVVVTPESLCTQAITVEAAAGETIDAVLSISPDGSCAPGA